MRACAALWAMLAGAVASAAPLDVRVLDPAGRPLDGAVVFVESAAAKAAARPLRGVEIAQEQRQFVPPVSVVTVGTVVGFPNRDTVRHHLYSFSPTPFDRKLYLGREAAPVSFDRAGIAVLGCNIHDAMIGWVVVVETPWFGITGADGRVRLDVPAGSHRLRAWHAGLPVGAPAADQGLGLAAAGGEASVTLAVETSR